MLFHSVTFFAIPGYLFRINEYVKLATFFLQSTSAQIPSIQFHKLTSKPSNANPQK